MKLVLHIGTPKTASTFLQNTCAANRNWLAQHGAIYPDLKAPDANHITLFYVSAQSLHDFARDYGLHTQQDVSRLRDKLGALLDKQIRRAPQGCDKVLLSSENLTGNLRDIEGIASLRDFLAPHFDEIKVLIYVRRQDDAMLSMYGEFMRRGFTSETFPTFANMCMGQASPTPYLYYRRMLMKWIEVFGRDAIIVRMFERERMHGGNILCDFLTTALTPGADAPLDISRIVPSPEDNASLSAPALEFLRRMQPHIPFRQNDELNQLREDLAGQINALPATPRPFMAAAQSRRIMQHFQPANGWLRTTFFPEKEAPLFAPRSDLKKDGNLGQISLDDFAAFSARLLQ